MTPRTFKTIFCEKYQCAESAYEELALNNCLYPHARFLAPALRTVFKNFFAKDLYFIKELGKAIDWQEVKLEMVDFQDSTRFADFARKHLLIRISGRRAQIMARRVMLRRKEALD